jgi:heptosyltransferase-1
MRILIVRLGALGDIVHAVPAAAALKRAMPDAEIDWVVEARHREIAGLVKGLRRRVTIDTARWGSVLPAIRELRAGRYDIALDLQGLLKSAVLARLSGASRVVGFGRAALREPAASRFYTEQHEIDDRQHIIRKNLSLVRLVAATDDRIEFPLDVPPRDPPEEPYVLLNPGAAWPNKRWPAERFGALAARLRTEHGVSSLVLWGPGERDLAVSVAAASGGAARPAPETSVADVLSLARGAALVVSGDTGPLHLAAAAGAPLVGLYGPTNPARNGPFARDDRVVSRFEACQCHYGRRCRRPPPCIDAIDLDEVVRAASERLARAGVADG